MKRLSFLASCWLWSCALVHPVGAGSVPNPKVIGPVPVTAKPGDPSHNYPFFAATVDLASQGYIEEEFFLEGTAKRFSTPPLVTGSAIGTGHPYRTRMVVRRPASPGKFNGTVLLEWQNVAAGYDMDAVWNATHEHLTRSGYAWIGVTNMQAGVHNPVSGLRVWSPARYGTLDMTHDGAILDDALCYDIFSQAAQSVRNPSGTDPMGGLQVERVLAAGASQFANRLATYHNSIHPLAGVVDAFLLVVGGARLRTDLDVKVFQILTETEVARGAVRQPDSDRFRRWEVAGAAHLDFYLWQELTALKARDQIPASPDACDGPPLSRIPFRFVGNAALDQLARWVKENVPPPHVPEIQLAEAGPPAVIARDEFGNALGGVRLPQHAVPTATNTGVNSGPAFCRLYGSFQPFDKTTLIARYPDRSEYFMQVVDAALEAVAAGFLLPQDAMATIRKARAIPEFPLGIAAGR